MGACVWRQRAGKISGRTHPVIDELLHLWGWQWGRWALFRKNPVNKCVTYITVPTNTNTSSGSVDLGSISRCCCCCHHWSEDHTLIRFLWEGRWYCGFLQLLNNLIKDFIKIYNLFWETTGLGLHTREYLPFHIVLSPSFHISPYQRWKFQNKTPTPACAFLARCICTSKVTVIHKWVSMCKRNTFFSKVRQES